MVIFPSVLLLLLFISSKFWQCLSFIQAYNSYYYMFCHDSVSFDWYGYQSYCRNNLGTQLASILNNDQQVQMNALRTNLSISSESILIGCYEPSGTENDWNWIDGSNFSFTNWNSGEPNDYNSDEDCCELYSNAGGAWNDVACSWSRSCAVCNMPSLLETVTTRTYNITIEIGSLSSSATFWMRINGTESNSYTNWFEFDSFYDSSSSYTLFPVFSNVGNCQTIQILTFSSDSISIDSIYCDNLYQNTTGAVLAVDIAYVCEYLEISFDENNIDINDNYVIISGTEKTCVIETNPPTLAPTLLPTNPTVKPTNFPTQLPAVTVMIYNVTFWVREASHARFWISILGDSGIWVTPINSNYDTSYSTLEINDALFPNNSEHSFIINGTNQGDPTAMVLWTQSSDALTIGMSIVLYLC